MEEGERPFDANAGESLQWQQSLPHLTTRAM
jgi:hypothetical protein